MVWIGSRVLRQFRAARRPADRRRAVRGVPAQGRGAEVAWWFRHASTLAVASGVLLLVLTGYLLPSLVYGTSVYVPPARACLLWGGVARRARHVDVRAHVHLAEHAGGAGLRPGDADAKARARARVILFARLNLVLVAAGRARHGGGGAPLLTWPTWQPTATPIAASARAGEPDRYLAALLAPPAARAASAGAGGVLDRARPRAAGRHARAGDGRDPPAVVARCAGGAATPARSPATPSPMRCATRRHRCALPVAAPARRDRRTPDRPCRASLAGRRRAAHLPVEKRGCAVCPGAGILRRAPGADVHATAAAAAKPTVWCGCCSACRSPCRAGACRCRNRAWMPRT